MTILTLAAPIPIVTFLPIRFLSGITLTSFSHAFAPTDYCPRFPITTDMRF